MLPIATSIGWYSFPTVELEADGQRFEGTLAMVFNVPRYALGLRLCPDACPDDGWLDWVVFARPGTVRLAVYAAAVALGQHRRLSDVHYGRAPPALAEVADSRAVGVGRRSGRIHSD